jgi:hypothetical protein
MQFRKQYRQWNWLSATPTRRQSARRERRHKRLRIALLTLLVLALIAGTTMLVVNPTARVAVVGGLPGTDCGTIILSDSLGHPDAPGFTTPDQANRSIACFADAYAACRPASISRQGIGFTDDEHFSETFVVAPAPGRCALVERGVIPGICNHGCRLPIISVDECTGAARLSDGLHLRGCGVRTHDLLVPARGSLLHQYNCGGIVLPASIPPPGAHSVSPRPAGKAQLDCFMTAYTYCVEGTFRATLLNGNALVREDIFEVVPSSTVPGSCAVIDHITTVSPRPPGSNSFNGPTGPIGTTIEVRCSAVQRMVDGLHFVGCELPPGISAIPVVPVARTGPDAGTPAPSL